MTNPSSSNHAIQHLSIRVPWHDNGWTGGICGHPEKNSSCLVLPRIREDRIDSDEIQYSGKKICDIAADEWPPCIHERGMFMAPFEYTRHVAHPYATSSSHSHILPTPFRHPPYSAATVPFRWMARKNAWDIAQEFQIDVSREREPTEPGWLERSSWVQAGENQKELLDCFFSMIQPVKSLCFFYAKQTPLLDEGGWVLIGAGRVKSVGIPTEYQYSNKTRNSIRSYLWDVSIEHTIRPEYKDGFLLPYHEILQKAAKDSSVDPAEYVALVPDDRRSEFSFTSEHVTHDGAIAALLACKEALERANDILDKPMTQALIWINERLSELWKCRGAYPGIGAALTAFGVTHGVIVAHHIQNTLEENEDPWPVIDKIFTNPVSLPQKISKEISGSLQTKWKNLKPERKDLLKILSRFELTNSQATRYFVQEERLEHGISSSDPDLLANPYLLYEQDRFADTRNNSDIQEPFSIWTLDRGLYPAPVVLKKHPLQTPTALDGPLDPRRIRAITIADLEQKAGDGHTLLPRDHIVMNLRNLDVDPPCTVDGDLFDVLTDHLAPEINIIQLADGKPAFQLKRFTQTGDLIRNEVSKRIKSKKSDVSADWEKLLDSYIGAGSDDPEEKRARDEKRAALSEIASSRFSVLIGPAGTGKTTILGTLCKHPAISSGGILLLAPTGKARVKLGDKCGIPAKTIAQFLVQYGRYSSTTCQYIMTNEKRFEGAKTVIIDESSMLTEEMLGAVLNTLKGVERLILAGDPSQLPPIGAGRPFVDIVNRLSPENIDSQFPKVGNGYAELTIQRRQIGDNPEDIQLAKWFSGKPLSPGDDEIWSRITSGNPLKRIRFVQWNTPEDLRPILMKILVEELHLSGEDDRDGFEICNGGSEFNGNVYFRIGAGKHAEDWQILTPFRNVAIGSRDINRFVQKGIRQDVLNWARGYFNDGRPIAKITPPRGIDEIVYGDKVINISNHPRKFVNPKIGALGYVANGEIGIVIGEYIPAKDSKGAKPWRTFVEFSSQDGYSYSYSPVEIGEDNTLLELAYAITIHKAQGSEFGLTILIIPDESRLMSRELLYTALTRQKDRIVILHQGKINDLRNFTSSESSATASRITNLFVTPNILEIKDIKGRKRSRYYENRLIHRSGRGVMMRSKSEVIIDDALAAKGIDASYEKDFIGDDDTSKMPDFTIQDDASGITYLWEHLGMLGDPKYKRDWERKCEWYARNGVKTREEGGGERATLIITRDALNGGIDAQEIQKIIKEIAS